MACLSELTVECVIRFGRFVRILKGSIGNGRKRPLFSMFRTIGLCVSMKICFFPGQCNGQVIRFGVLKFLVIESELTIECVIWFGRIVRISKDQWKL